MAACATKLVLPRTKTSPKAMMKAVIRGWHDLSLAGSRRTLSREGVLS